MPVTLDWTPRAEQQFDGLRSRQQQQVAQFLRHLEAEGCAALGYRLTGGAPLDRLCVKHVGDLRIVVAFRSGSRACVVLIGRHDEADPGLDVYAALYELAGVKPPTDPRTKPPCCDDGGLPPEIGAAVDELADRAVRIRRTRRGDGRESPRG
ncbi:hypothetical protein [Catellatospora citrea]|uniref:Uncharacterized protein n=1 Tax=Catellatospora citrea TaxID=53366 RepID=A0A8J3KPR0_9ACTN|nr:hypothetical protein [Catellatospora citrea]RKE10825.1 mRNA-degrading endonuclease RelE of RelBE toxin-antitoxin system [Catellatospora citrea]GIG00936.1 hypothetical protein Cci01nite_60290 [Catellatospora citrea]